MARDPKGDRGIPTKATYGGLDVDHFSPEPDGRILKALNIVIRFEEALKLHLSLGQLLGQLNRYNRSSSRGKRSAVGLCVFIDKKRITVNENMVRQPSTQKPSAPSRRPASANGT